MKRGMPEPSRTGCTFNPDLIDDPGREERGGKVAAAHDADALAGPVLEVADELAGVRPHELDGRVRVGRERAREDVALDAFELRAARFPGGNLPRLAPINIVSVCFQKSVMTACTSAVQISQSTAPSGRAMKPSRLQAAP